ncbi:MAG: aminotransferase class V-fold PLP-dependent enzyme [Chloroflexi bacterium]|nr:aminotransferase class V-fold PLP-dependent enzyme [Chloroflexota bacterium]
MADATKSPKMVYMDHSATTAVHPRVVDAMLPFFTQQYGNPSSIYSLAQDAARAVDTARDQVARVLNARNSEVIFTSGGTESDNTALRGAAFALQKSGNHIITTSIEHHAILHTCEWLAEQGFEITYLKPDREGFVSPEQVAAAMTERTTVVSVMYANNEIGSVEPIADISKAVKARAAELKRKVIIHTDAVQAAGWLPLDVNRLGVDMLSLSSHKFNGPKGVGVLYLRQQAPFSAQAMGGSQERNRRAGTENTPGIVGTGLAIAVAEEARIQALEGNDTVVRHRDRLIEALLAIPDTRLNGPRDDRRLANNVNVSFARVEIESVLVNLDFAGIAASSGSACTSGSIDPSHVLLAIGLPHGPASSSLRLSLGRENTDEEVDRVLDVLPGIVQRVRALTGPGALR